MLSYQLGQSDILFRFVASECYEKGRPAGVIRGVCIRTKSFISSMKHMYCGARITNCNTAHQKDRCSQLSSDQSSIRTISQTFSADYRRKVLLVLTFLDANKMC